MSKIRILKEDEYTITDYEFFIPDSTNISYLNNYKSENISCELSNDIINSITVPNIKIKKLVKNRKLFKSFRQIFYKAKTKHNMFNKNKRRIKT